MDNNSLIFDSVDLRRENLDEQIAEKIESMIKSDQLKIGERLPSERELANILGVNRATVRTAIQILSERGLLAMRQGSGTYVTQVSSQVVGDRMALYFVTQRCTHDELNEVRRVIEPEIAASAAQNRTNNDLKHLEDQLLCLENVWNDEDIIKIGKADADYHLGLARATGNSLFIAITSGIYTIMAEHIAQRYNRGRSRSSLNYHRSIFEAIVARDTNKARDLMLEHMDKAIESELMGSDLQEETN